MKPRLGLFCLRLWLLWVKTGCWSSVAGLSGVAMGGGVSGRAAIFAGSI